MDTDNLIAHSRARFAYEAAKRTLREKYQGKMVFAYNGGMWRAGPELQTMIFTCGSDGVAFLPDLYENPIQINTRDLMKLSQERWKEQMAAWHDEYEQLSKNR